MTLLNFASDFFGNSARDVLTPDSEELSSLLRAVLPTLIAAVDGKRNALFELALPMQSTQESEKLLWDFHLRLYAGLTNLQAVIVQWSPADMIQSSSAEEARMKLLLEAVLSCFEERFLSRKDRNAGPAFKRLGIEYIPGTTLWKLRALKKSKRLPARDEEMSESYLRDIDLVMRLDSKKAAKRAELLLVIEAAFDFFVEMQFFSGEPTSPCPLQYLNYPMKHVAKLTKTLFGAIQSKWSCQCVESPSHVSRMARWNLTQHQRFDTAPVPEAARRAIREARTWDVVQFYRVFFPTTAREAEWQDTDIAVDFREYLDEENCKIDNDLCRVISSVKAGIRPRMAVWAKELWLLRADAEERPSVLTQIKEAEFVSLTELLLQHSSHKGGPSSRRSIGDAAWRPKDRLILSFILATTLLHLSQISGPCPRADLTSDSICFLRPSQRAPLDITRPYLTVKCALRSSTHPQQSSSAWNQPHRFPDILALGILLLEIERGAPVRLDTSQDPCVVAIKELDDWTMSLSLSAKDRSVPEGLRHAIAACIQPKQFKTHNLDKANIRDNDIRRYIFDRVIYPLEEALFTAYEIKPHMLPAYSDQRKAVVDGSGSFDGEEASQVDKYQRAAAVEWTENLEGIYDLVYACQDQCEEFAQRNGSDWRAERVKIAVLDTGLQLPESLRASYEDDGRIAVNESKSFVCKADGQASEHDWDSDCDGHGSRVGEIILRCAPCADLHVAKVFQTSRDLTNPALADQVHKQIADAIDLATNSWKVDMIVMCFGFDEPIRPIRDAINRATKTSKPPLFFAATRNEGAHREVAWPASDFSVIGISSTTAEGEASPFNSRERDDAYPILYAFGQNVPVNVASSSNPQHFEKKYVSGTSYATPVAASLAANLLGSVRMLVKTSSPEDRARFAHVPGDLQESRGMLRVLQGRMQSEHVSGQKSLLPWDFLCLDMMKENKLLREVDRAMNGKPSRG
ncbi:subtilase [Colletotrichum musicola]|uniref:Subtilase n=1 Tax=Colletotrichum musicola TaxID=2175873 RepID=A0A8H6KHW9_9PEZI|nr:subtilase [Colletotrichum musicola]